MRGTLGSPDIEAEVEGLGIVFRIKAHNYNFTAVEALHSTKPVILKRFKASGRIQDTSYQHGVGLVSRADTG